MPWNRHLNAAIQEAANLTAALKTDRRGRDQWLCPRCRGVGLSCEHLPRSGRRAIWKLLELFGYRGASVEVGVWQGDNSREMMGIWRSGRRHTMVDPYRNFECVTRSSTGKRESRDKQCMVDQTRFDHVYQLVSKWAKLRHPKRAALLREFSVDAAARFEHTSLDMVYIDARHDFDGVTEDLRAWWPTVCPGGIFAGHDLEYSGVKRSVEAFLARHSSQAFEVRITAEHSTPSWFVVRKPRVC